MHAIPLYLIFVPVILSLVIYLAERRFVSRLIFPVQALLWALYILLIRAMPESGVFLYRVGGWPDDTGITLKADSLSLAFLGMTLLVWTMVILFSWDQHKDDVKYLFFLTFLEGTFLGLLLVNDLFSFYLAVEICSIVAGLLVIFKRDGWSLRAGLYYMLINSMGMQAYLLGMIFVYMLTGTLNWDIATHRLAWMPASPAVLAAFVLMVSGVCVKAAFAPTFNWLSRAHGAAPAPVSALLSAVLVKAGVYGFIRICQLFGRPMTGDFFLYLGFVTAIAGLILALAQKDIKQLLALSTVSQMGLMLIGISQLSGPGYTGGLLHLFAHAGYKGLLFMAAGVVINGYHGERRLTELRGVFSRYPRESILMILAILAVSGAPLSGGYPGKFLVAESLKGSPVQYILYQTLTLGTMLYYIKFSQIFLPDTRRMPAVTAGKNPTGMAALVLATAFTVGFPFLYRPAGRLMGTELPGFSVPLYAIALWVLVLLGAILFFRFFIYTDRLTPVLHQLREMNLPYYLTAYMFLFLLGTMYVFGLFSPY